MSTPRQRTPGRHAPGSPQKAQRGPKTQPVPTADYTGVTYTQEELDADLCKAKMGTLLYERGVVVLAFAAMCVYLAWRWTLFLSSPSTYWVSIPLIVSETCLVVPGLFISYFIVWHRIHRPSKRLADLKIQDKDLPAVDVYIPCYGEPVSIIRDTLIAATNIDYPQYKLKLYVCDDGKREDTRKMVDEVKAETAARGLQVAITYIAREKTKGVPHHAKAGNLNNAILNCNTTGEYLVIFDCDMICDRSFLQALLPHFYHRTERGHEIDESIAIVQSPQSFVGVPASDPLGQQYRYFYGPVMQGWDGAGCAPCCGTNVIFSRKCLTSVGGFVYGSVTEDFLTSMYLHNAGYKSKYVHEYLARGLSPDSLHDFMKQRLRWAAGAVEIFYFHNSLKLSGLTWKQTYLYFWAGLQAFLTYPLLLVCIVPFVALADRRILVAPMDSGQYLYFMGSFMFFTIWMLFVSYRGVPKLYLMRSVQESVFMIFNKMEAVAQVTLKGKMQFAVTKKNLDQMSPIRKDIGHVIPHLIYYVLAMLAVARVAYNSTLPDSTSAKMLGDAVCLIWVAVVLWQLYPPIGVVIAGVRQSMSAPAPSAGPASPKVPPATPKLPASP